MGFMNDDQSVEQGYAGLRGEIRVVPVCELTQDERGLYGPQIGEAVAKLNAYHQKMVGPTAVAHYRQQAEIHTEADNAYRRWKGLQEKVLVFTVIDEIDDKGTRTFGCLDNYHNSPATIAWPVLEFYGPGTIVRGSYRFKNDSRR